MVYYPFAPGMYDKRAPAGHIRNPTQSFPTANAPEENYVSLFSDDNVHAACSIMWATNQKIIHNLYFVICILFLLLLKSKGNVETL